MENSPLKSVKFGLLGLQSAVPRPTPNSRSIPRQIVAKILLVELGRVKNTTDAAKRWITENSTAAASL